MKSINWNFKIFFASFILLSFFEVNAQQLNLTLTPSNYNGYNIRCFGNFDGSIDLTIAGGIPPYQILWSTADTIDDLENLPAGYYTVRVTDSDSLPQIAQAEMTLTEPRQLKIGGTINKYPNGYNISIYGACNGMVNFTGEDGVGPYSWLWSDSSSVPNRSSLCADWYSVLILDANGCKAGKEGYMKEPSRKDWLLSGNEETEPDVNFLGTIDSTDLVLKTNNFERLRISGKGDIEFHGDLKLDSASIDTIRLVFVDRDGFLRTYGPGNPSPIAPAPDWNTKGNDISNIPDPFIGTLNAADLVFKTSNGWTAPNEAMRINQAGGVGIGTSTIPAGYKMVVDGKVGFREAYVKLSGSWPDYVFSGNYELNSIDHLEKSLSLNKKLPGFPSAEQIELDGQNIGEIQRLQQEKIEELYLYIIDLNKKIELLQKENEAIHKKLKN